jgi:phenylalanine-4-hydroxylase
VRPFDPEVTAVQTYPITEYQPVYFLAASFLDAKKKMREFSRTLSRPFGVRYNPYSQAIDIIATRADIATILEEIQRNAAEVMDTLKRIPVL